MERRTATALTFVILAAAALGACSGSAGAGEVPADVVALRAGDPPQNALMSGYEADLEIVDGCLYANQDGRRDLVAFYASDLVDGHLVIEGERAHTGRTMLSPADLVRDDEQELTLPDGCRTGG